jgi:hypothetical protein
MEMRNFRQRFGAFVLAGMMAGVLGSATAFADMGGPNRNTCAFILGHVYKAPADSAAAAVFRAFYLSWDCPADALPQ